MEKHFTLNVMHKIRLCLFIVLFTGCVETTSTSPPVELPDEFSSRGDSTWQDQWWRQFNDPQLNIYIALAISKNFTIRTATEKIIEAEALARQAGAALLPTVDANGNFTSKKTTGTPKTETFSLGVAASYEIDLWGRLRAAKEAARTDVLAQKENFETAALSVAAEVALSWFACIENSQQCQRIKKQQEINRQNKEIIEIRVRTGLAQMADLLQQRQLIQANEATLAELTARGKILNHRLQTLLGQTPRQEDTKDIGTLPLLPPLPETGIPLTLLQQRPDIQAAWFALAAADQRTAAAVASRFPRLSLRAEQATTGTSSRDLFNNWLTTLAANLIGPIIDGGNRRAEVVRRQAVARQRYYLWGESILNALKEVEDALVQEKALREQLRSHRQQLELAGHSVELISLRYRQGAEDYQRVLQAVLSLQELERVELRTQLQLLTNRVTLYRALSRGLPETIFQLQAGEK